MLLLTTSELALIPAFMLAASKVSKFFTENDDSGVPHGTCVINVEACIAHPGDDFLIINPSLHQQIPKAAFPKGYRDINGNYGLNKYIRFIKNF
jgi:hypothetical protein